MRGIPLSFEKAHSPQRRREHRDKRRERQTVLDGGSSILLASTISAPLRLRLKFQLLHNAFSALPLRSLRLCGESTSTLARAPNEHPNP